jgi:predicted lipoprotein with Yx(FWY)xxD motif
MRFLAPLSVAAVALSACATAPVAVVPAATATVTTATKPPYGTYLVDAAGRSLYILEGTRNGMGMDRCTAQCLVVWPPLHSAAPPVAAAGVDPARLTVVQMHGAPHVNYAGWPLYYYSHDAVRGDTSGQHVTDAWGTWHLLAPSGEPIRP